MRIGVALAVSLIVVASAHARSVKDELIRPGVGIAKARLGMTEGQVRKVMGRPMARLAEPASFGNQKVRIQYGFASYTITLIGKKGRERVVAMSTVLRKERTPQGIGVGSGYQDLERAFERLDCTAFEYRDYGRGLVFSNGIRRCYVRGGDAATVFLVSGPAGRRGEFEQQWPREANVDEVVVRAATYRERNIGE